jgi:hypothetical protein
MKSKVDGMANVFNDGIFNTLLENTSDSLVRLNKRQKFIGIIDLQCPEKICWFHVIEFIGLLKFSIK